jgi:hypothetical protein
MGDSVLKGDAGHGSPLEKRNLAEHLTALYLGET